ncbi:MAG: hypothetical protein IT441_08065 [Phycisphaeraceae bacterium]|nr:hypothetical protein [Phycisphaeraceae bacterium]
MNLRHLIGLSCLLGMLWLGTGCQESLFPKDMPRSQYERYSMLRGQDRPATETNMFGREEPALRDRLRPLGEEF